MDADLRASLFAALGAAVLSALVGVFAGVVFVWIVLRALIFGAVMGAAALGVAKLLRSILPGLIPDRYGEGDERSESIFSDARAVPAAGSRVDIVLPGEGGEVAEAEAVDQVDDESVSAADEAEDGQPQDAEASLIDEPQPEGGAAAPARPVTTVREARPESLDDLDVLPDLDGFTDSFAAAEFSSSGGAADAARAMPQEGVSARPSDGLDPASLAKAVRTILKRDQKG